MVHSSHLLLAEKQAFEQDDDADADQDHGGDNHAVYIGSPDNLDDDGEAAKKGQCADAPPGFT